MSRVKKNNEIKRKAILKSLLAHGSMTLAEISKSTSISLPIVTKFILNLEKEGFVEEI